LTLAAFVLSSLYTAVQQLTQRPASGAAELGTFSLPLFQLPRALVVFVVCWCGAHDARCSSARHDCERGDAARRFPLARRPSPAAPRAPRRRARGVLAALARPSVSRRRLSLL
jgi:hypothetical protein